MDLQAAHDELCSRIIDVSDFNEFNKLKSEYLGKSGILNEKFNVLKQSKPEDFKQQAEVINKFRSEWNILFRDKQSIMQEQLEQLKLEKEAIDVSLPCDKYIMGSQHPVSTVRNRIVKIMHPLGFSEVSGPEIEDDYHNFQALNVPEYHPARGMQDTFYFGNGSLLRTQTSSVQVHQLKTTRPPLKIISAGRVYRRDSDQTHSPMFHQLEMLAVDRNCSFSDLKAVLLYTFNELFQQKLRFRFRPSYFPFTEPSGELDIEWQGSWLEVAGYGMVHPKVLKMQNIDTNEFNGYAFGVGLDRLAMILYGIKDLRLLFQNDLRFLKQFNGESI